MYVCTLSSHMSQVDYILVEEKLQGRAGQGQGGWLD
jgi:hypothetical protein